MLQLQSAILICVNKLIYSFSAPIQTDFIKTWYALMVEEQALSEHFPTLSKGNTPA